MRGEHNVNFGVRKSINPANPSANDSSAESGTRVFGVVETAPKTRVRIKPA